MTTGPHSKKVTRRDVARAAGVSDAVVSYTLTGSGPVAPATAARVRAAVKALGYVPNAAASALKSGSSKLLGMIVPDSSSPFWASLCQEVERVAAPLGYRVLIANSDEGPALPIARSLMSRQVDGYLIAPSTPLHQAEVDSLDSLGAPWVILDNARSLDGVTGIGTDLVEGAHLATRHLIEHGYERIGFVGRTHEARYEGWRGALAEAGLPEGLVFPSEFIREEGYRAGSVVVAAAHRLDAVFVASDMLAVGVLRALHEAHVAVPGDLALAALDGTYESEYAWPPITTVRQPLDVVARSAVTYLLDHGRAVEARPQGQLVIRRSCGCNR